MWPPSRKSKPTSPTGKNRVLLVDTNILLALLVSSDWSQDARALYSRDADWRSESHALVELSNVLTRYVRVRKITVPQAVAALDEAEALIGKGIYKASHGDALEIAVKEGISAYDARFVCAARLLGVPLITEDVKLRKAAPKLTCSLADALTPNTP